jgi:hypothetical protein
MSGLTECHEMGGLKHPCSPSPSPISIIKWVSVERISNNLKLVNTSSRSTTTNWLLSKNLATDIFFLHEQLTQHARNWI